MQPLDLDISQYDISTLIAFILLIIVIISTPLLLVYWIKTNLYKNTNELQLSIRINQPVYLFEQYHLFLVKPEDLGETKYIKKNKRKESIEYQEQTHSPYYQAQPEKEKQERLQSSYIKFFEELYEKQVGIWIANHYTIVETYEELEKYHERYWEQEPISILEQPLQ
ncbi:hypothetical protein C2G38_2249118 [Gigaspora rosea]|uniref:Uncharacterized protein n=1 Tax=Gigaspora rosea TaxID=44941 RepID=A0A397UT72_9GLOM|nr:hypothetical protein C2G38_2249118 [Gigaspora rosea]